MFILLISCSSTLNFSGESTNWKVKYNPTINTKTNSEQGTYEFRFKGKKMKDNTVDELVIESESKNTRVTDISLQKGVIRVPVSCSGCAISNKYTSIRITIKWDDIEESLILK
ncbi:hypothetical protein D3C74_278320 [compost metagenome]